MAARVLGWPGRGSARHDESGGGEAGMGGPWWRSAVIYQIYPRSFADSGGDGVGDLAGVCSRLDYVAALGVDGIWLSPIYRSPMADFGYDVSDHTAVDPGFGDLEGFDRLLAEAHRRGLRLILDWVPNHTSSEHPWFRESRSSRDSPKRGWYVWRDGRGDEPPNNWRSAFGGPAWTWDEATAQWYLHLFLPGPARPGLGKRGGHRAMHDVLALLARPRRGRLSCRRRPPDREGRNAAGPARGDRAPRHRGDPRAPAHPRASTRHPHAARRLPGQPDDGRRGAAQVSCAPRSLPRRRRRASSRLQLRADAPALVCRGIRRCVTRSGDSLRGIRAMALLGAVESRPASPPLTLRGLRGPRPRGCAHASHAARDAVPLRRRGAGLLDADVGAPSESIPPVATGRGRRFPGTRRRCMVGPPIRGYPGRPRPMS